MPRATTATRISPGLHAAWIDGVTALAGGVRAPSRHRPSEPAQQLRGLEQRQSDNARETAGQKPDKTRRRAIDGVTACLAFPFAQGEPCDLLRLVQTGETDNT